MPNTPKIFSRIGNAMRRNNSPAAPDSERKASPQTPPRRRGRGPGSPITPRRLSFGEGSPRQEEREARVPRSANRTAQGEWRERTESAFAPFALAVKAMGVHRMDDSGLLADRPMTHKDAERVIRPLMPRDVEMLVAVAEHFTSYKAVRDTPGMPALRQHDEDARMFKEMLEEHLKSMIQASTLRDLQTDELDNLAQALDDLEVDHLYIEAVKTESALPRNEREEPSRQLALTPPRAAKPQVPLERHHRYVPTDFKGAAAVAQRQEENFKNTSHEFSRGVITLELAHLPPNPPPSGEFSRSDFNHVLALALQFKSYKLAREALKTRFESYSKERATSEKEAIRIYRDRVNEVVGFREKLRPLLTQAFKNFSGKGLNPNELQNLSAALQDLELAPDSTIAVRVREVRRQRPNVDGPPRNLPPQMVQSPPRNRFIDDEAVAEIIPEAPEQPPAKLQGIKGPSSSKAELPKDSVANLQREQRARDRVTKQMMALAYLNATPEVLRQAARLLPTTADVPIEQFEMLAMSLLREWDLPQLDSLAANLELVGEVSTQASLYVGAVRRSNTTVRMEKVLVDFGLDVGKFTSRQSALPGVFTRTDFNMVIALAEEAAYYEATRGNDALVRRDKGKLWPTLNHKLAQDVFDGGNFSDLELEALHAALIGLGATVSATSVANVLSMHADAEARIADEFVPPPPDDENA